MFPQVMMWPAGVVRSMYCGRADVQHPRCVANAARMEGDIDDLLFAVRRLSGVGIRQEKRPPVIWTCTAPIPLLALPCHAVAHNIRALTVGTVQCLKNHEALSWVGVSLLSSSYQG